LNSKSSHFYGVRSKKFGKNSKKIKFRPTSTYKYRLRSKNIIKKSKKFKTSRLFYVS
jgi:hypothetical protein